VPYIMVVHYCKHCTYSSPAIASVVKHERTHTDERPFRCCVSPCDKSFKTEEHLHQHHATHTGQKLHICKRCGSQYTQRGSLRAHEKSAHDGVRYLCPYKYCNKDYAKKVSAARHACAAHNMPYNLSVVQGEISKIVIIIHRLLPCYVIDAAVCVHHDAGPSATDCSCALLGACHNEQLFTQAATTATTALLLLLLLLLLLQLLHKAVASCAAAHLLRL
jgi:hypothetical protein